MESPMSFKTTTTMDFFMAALSRNEQFLFTSFFFDIKRGRGETAYFHGRRPRDFLLQFVEEKNVNLKQEREREREFWLKKRMRL